uniref:Uncharacterized protein n=1 Tax=Cacopsylla melanoneura TaxID=428564 RepID=A0A8D8THA7_9HEMI
MRNDCINETSRGDQLGSCISSLSMLPIHSSITSHTGSTLIAATPLTASYTGSSSSLASSILQRTSVHSSIVRTRVESGHCGVTFSLLLRGGYGSDGGRMMMLLLLLKYRHLHLMHARLFRAQARPLGRHMFGHDLTLPDVHYLPLPLLLLQQL